MAHLEPTMALLEPTMDHLEPSWEKSATTTVSVVAPLALIGPWRDTNPCVRCARAGSCCSGGRTFAIHLD